MESSQELGILDVIWSYLGHVLSLFKGNLINLILVREMSFLCCSPSLCSQGRIWKKILKGQYTNVKVFIIISLLIFTRCRGGIRNCQQPMFWWVMVMCCDVCLCLIAFGSLCLSIFKSPRAVCIFSTICSSSTEENSFCTGENMTPFCGFECVSQSICGWNFQLRVTVCGWMLIK